MRVPDCVPGQASAILLGRPYRYTPEMKFQLFDVVRKVLREFDREDMPVVADLDFGHTSPQFVLPNGCNARVDPIERTVDLVEPGVA